MVRGLHKLYGEPQLQWQIDKGLTGECEILCDMKS